MQPINDRTALALTMIGEARGEGNDGMEAVGHTIMNRTLHPSWRGKTIMDVCLKPWQYSCWNENDPNRGFLTGMNASNPLFMNAIKLADNIIDGLPDTTNGATYYYRKNSAMPNWAIGKTPCFELGNHLFFKDVA